MGFDGTGPFVLTMFRIITTDVPYFINFYFIVVVAFACALSVLARSQDPTAGYGFVHVLKATWTLIQDTVGIDATHDNINSVLDYPQHLQTVNHEWFENDENSHQLPTAVGVQPNPVAAVAVGAPRVGKVLNRKTTLFIIGPQYDILPEVGAVAIPNADADCQRIADMIDSFGEEHIHEIYVTMDCRSPCHIAHAVSWHAKDRPDEHPTPYTQISNADVMGGRWVYADKRPEMQSWAEDYTAALERKGRFVLTILPEHCIVGTKGHAVVPVINEALQRWAHRSCRPVNYIMKGQNIRVDMFSAFQAEERDPLDPNTDINMELLTMLKTAGRLLICGQALSHCVNYTTRDIIDNWDKAMSSLVVLTDGASPRGDLHSKVDAEKFLRHCAGQGVTLSSIAHAFDGCKPKMRQQA